METASYNDPMKTLPRSLRFLSTIIVLGFVSALHAQSPQNPYPISGPKTITVGGYYRLTNSIITSATTGNIITIQANNVTIDFNGFFINGPVNTATNLIGVYANEYGNLTIKNGSIAYCKDGIVFTGNDNPTTTRNINHVVENMRITRCYEYGIYIPASSPGTVVSNCQFSQIAGSTVSGAFAIAVYGPGSDQTILVRDNIVNTVGPTASFPAYGAGIVYAFAVRNSVASCASYGFIGGKYQNNLTSNCPTPFTGGVDAGHNN
jgi:hypothetical protein